MKLRLLALAALCTAVLAACTSEEVEAPPPVRPVLSVVVEPVARSAASFVGTVEPRVTIQQAFRVGGTLVSRNVDIGDTVSRGQLLAGLEATTLSLAVQTAQANFTSAQAQFANASASEQRLQALLEQGNVSSAAIEQAQQQTQAAQAGVVQAQSRLTQAQEQLGYARIEAGFDGIVTDVGAEMGEVVSPGQMIVTLAQPANRDVVIDVPEAFVGQVSLGARFTVAPQLDPASAVNGTLREIAPEADPVTRTWRLHIGLEDPPASFWLGTTATASPEISDETHISLPETAVRRQGGTASVWVVDETAGTVSERAVEIGEAASGEVPVVSGLEAGERVVTAGVNSLAEGQQIRLDRGQGE
jgi:RND family efflux transporter MFP subunit